MAHDPVNGSVSQSTQYTLLRHLLLHHTLLTHSLHIISPSLSALPGTPTPSSTRFYCRTLYPLTIPPHTTHCPLSYHTLSHMYPPPLPRTSHTPLPDIPTLSTRCCCRTSPTSRNAMALTGTCPSGWSSRVTSARCPTMTPTESHTPTR